MPRDVVLIGVVSHQGIGDTVGFGANHAAGKLVRVVAGVYAGEAERGLVLVIVSIHAHAQTRLDGLGARAPRLAGMARRGGVGSSPPEFRPALDP